MARIYASAEEVAISYGRVSAICPGMPDNPRRRPFARKERGVRKTSWAIDGEDATASSGASGAIVGWDTQARDMQWLEEVTGKGYWSRLWIVQELIMARKAVVLHRDGESMSLRTFLKRARSLSNGLRCPHWQWCSIRFSHLFRLNYFLDSIAADRKKGTRLSLRYALTMCRDRRCRDWRDRIYALLSIVDMPPHAPSIPIDYRVTRVQLALNVVHACAGDAHNFASTVCTLLEVKDPVQKAAIYEQAEQYEFAALEHFRSKDGKPDAKDKKTVSAMREGLGLDEVIDLESQTFIAQHLGRGRVKALLRGTEERRSEGRYDPQVLAALGIIHELTWRKVEE